VIPWRRRLLTICVSAILIASCLSASAVTVGEYNRTLIGASDRIQAALRAERGHRGSGRPILDDLSRSLPSTMPVDIQGGKPVNADLRWIKTEIGSIIHDKATRRPDRLRDLADRVRMAAGVGKTAQPAQGVSAPGARSTLHKVLSRKEYGHSIVNDLSERMIRAIQEVIGRIFGAVPEGAWGIMGYILAGIAILAFAAALVFLVLKIIAAYSNPAPRRVRVEERHERVSKRPSLESLLQAAEDDASRARYREAFRSIYLATLYLLDRANLITYSDGNTNGEYMRALRRQSAREQAQVFGDMTLLFDQSIYGGHDVSVDDYLRSKSRFHELEGML
jgi:hypothetical protein